MNVSAHTRSLARKYHVGYVLFLIGVMAAALWALSGQLGQRGERRSLQSSAQPAVAAGASELKTGEPLARELGLGLQQSAPADCRHYIVVKQGGAGYCLDSVAKPGTVAARALGDRLAGHVPTEVELEIYRIENEIARLSIATDRAEIERLLQRLGQLKDQQQEQLDASSG